MPSYVNLLILVVGVMIGAPGGRAQLAAAEPGGAGQASQPAESPSQDAAAATTNGHQPKVGRSVPGDAGGSPPAKHAVEPAPEEGTSTPEAEQSAGSGDPGRAQAGVEPGEKQAAGEPEAEPADTAATNGHQPKVGRSVPGDRGDQIESWTARTVFNLLLLAVFVAVLVGPFYLGHRLTKDWRQPLWAWPIGLARLCVAVVASVFLLRWLLAPLPEAFASQFERYLDVLVRLRNLWIAVALVALPVWLGAYLSRKWRMPEYSGRIAIVSFAVLAGLVVTIMGWPPRRGIDLMGGVILVYEFENESGGGTGGEGDESKGEGEELQGEEQAGQSRNFDMDQLIHAIRLRVDPSNVRELTIREYGERQIEVIIPEADEEELARIKKKISSAGTLEFRILANHRDHQPVIDRALKTDARELYQLDENDQRVLDENGRPILQARWVRVAKGEEEGLVGFSGRAETVYRKSPSPDYEWTEFLLVKDIFNVNGSYLVSATRGIDQSGRPSVLFAFNQTGGNLFGALTAKNLPNEAQDFSRHLGILLDGYLQSAPAIRSTIFQRGEITGDFTLQEVKDLVDILNAGSLPTALSEEPVSETYMGPGLGQDTIERGRLAMIVSLALVLAFMAIYYRFAGVVACMALLVNLVLILAIMISIKAAFTLPGLAGLVLTMGMAVDGNVLIYERIREELSRQATLRMAIRNGFARATTTIVDANLTTLITATVLYVIGTDQIKGFAIILWLGVVLGMFTAIYCSRLVFDLADRQKWISRLRMMQMLTKTRIDFLGMRWLAIGGSIALIVIGLVAVGGRGSGLLDIDFTGGVSVRAVFNKPQDIADLRAKLGEQGEGLEDLAVSDLRSLDQTETGLQFVINTSGTRDMKSHVRPEKVLAEVKKHIQNAFGDDLAHYSMTVTVLPSGADTAKPAAESAGPATETGARNDLPPDALLASTEASAVVLAEQPAAPATEEPAAAEKQGPANQTRAKLDFDHKVNYEALREIFDGTIGQQKKSGLLEGDVECQLFIDEAFSTVDPEAARKTWFVSLTAPPDQAQTPLSAIEEHFESEPVFPSSNTIGGQVAGKTRVDAIMALLASLVFIVGYIWIRFQRVMFGLAAVIALVHDVLITLGAIALTAYVAPFLGFLLIDEFKIGLPVLAAFLTIIGYSLNDTIVVFDRIREVRGKTPRLTQEMINNSINQTLSRTLLTSLTTLLVVVVLYIGGGQGIHVFAFALLVGIVVGTYSSIFIASPILFWMANASAAAPKGQPAGRS